MPKKKKVKKVKKVKKSKKIKFSNKLKSSLKTVDRKSISAVNEEKPEIKKIKKQPTEKRIYNLKDFVVYPKHGVGKITAIEKAKIGEIDIQFYKILVEKEKLTKVDFIKLDVDGYELDVLKSGEKFLKINKPIIFTEIAPYLYPEFGYNCYELIKFFKELNYDFFDENLKKVSDISILVDNMKDGSTKNFFLF